MEIAQRGEFCLGMMVHGGTPPEMLFPREQSHFSRKITHDLREFRLRLTIRALVVETWNDRSQCSGLNSTPSAIRRLAGITRESNFMSNLFPTGGLPDFGASCF